MNAIMQCFNAMHISITWARCSQRWPNICWLVTTSFSLIRLALFHAIWLSFYFPDWLSLFLPIIRAMNSIQHVWDACYCLIPPQHISISHIISATSHNINMIIIYHIIPHRLNRSNGRKPRTVSGSKTFFPNQKFSLLNLFLSSHNTPQQ